MKQTASGWVILTRKLVAGFHPQNDILTFPSSRLRRRPNTYGAPPCRACSALSICFQEGVANFFGIVKMADLVSQGCEAFG